MVNVFGENAGNGPGNLQMAKKGKYKDYANEIRQSYEMVHLLSPIVFMVGGYMYWTMKLQ